MKDIEQIVSLCLEIDGQCAEFFQNLAAGAGIAELAGFWTSQAEREKNAAASWYSLLDLVQSDTPLTLFHEPAAVVQELTGEAKNIGKLLARSATSQKPTEQIALAFRLFACKLQPSMLKLRRFYGFVRPGDENQPASGPVPELIDLMRSLGIAGPELEILGEVVVAMGQQTRDLAADSTRDALTGILNRDGLFCALNTSAFLAKRNGHHTGLLMIDVDQLAGINASRGQQAGDAVLREISRTLGKGLEENDVLGRFGGQKFLVFLPQVAPRGIEPLAEGLRSAVERTLKKSIPATVSIGACGHFFTGDTDNELHHLLTRAEATLQEAKKNGGNCVHCQAALT